MQIITLKVENSKDLFLLIKLAERLGINIIKHEEPAQSDKKKKHTWKYIGATKLNGQLDNINLRDFAHE